MNEVVNRNNRQVMEISDKELSLKRMALSPWQEGVTKLAVSNKEKRKQLWDVWKTKNPESKKPREQTESKAQTP